MRVKKTDLLFILVISAALALAACTVKVNSPYVPPSEPVTDSAAEDVTAPEEEKPQDTPSVEDNADTENMGENLIPGGDFSEKNSAWGLYRESGGSASFTVSQGQLVLSIDSPGSVGHGVQLYCGGFEILQGGVYEFSADISSDVPRTIEWRIQLNGGDYHAYIDIDDIAIGPDTVTVSSEFVMEETSDPAPRMCFNLGDADGSQGLGAHNIYFDNVRLVLKDDSGAKKVENMGELAAINVDQIGYRTKDEKRAVIRSVQDNDTSFEVIDTKTNESVFTGDITPGITYGSSGDKVSYADLSALTAPGRYRVVTANSGQSYDFDIADDVYHPALSDTLRMLYLQRCGTELPKELAGDFAHKTCHTEEACIYGTDEYIEVSGGWHDAGDYGRYASPAAKAVADLLLSYELFPDAFDDNNNIPESGNGIPDILDEARYELDWLHKMQDADGGVYHKVTGLNFDGFVNPDECTEKLYVLPKSKTATADFAGVMFMAARVYKDIDPDFAKKCTDGAYRALDYYTAHIDESNFTNPKDVNTGEYKDGCSVDEFLWAICEGYKTMHDVSLQDKMDLVDMSRIKVDDFGWADMSGYAYYAYLTSEEPLKASDDIEKRFFDMCDNLKDTAISGEAYGATITGDYPWGSNMTIANNGMALLLANSIRPNEDYVRAAKRQLDYLFGTNTCSYCFLTGYGTQSPTDPHHRPSQAVGKCMKGMLIGGPDSRLEDPYAKAVLTGLDKAKCYTDNTQSYSCNEITIYWNSPLCFLLAAFQ